MPRTVSLLAAALCAVVWLMAGPSRCVAGETSPAEKKGDGKKDAEEKWLKLETEHQEAKWKIVNKVYEKQIENALNDPTEMHYPEPGSPLQDVIGYLMDAHGILIQINEKTLHDVGTDSDANVKIDVKGISLRSALNLMLAQLELTYVIQDEVLLITTTEDAKTRVTTKVYPVADLLPPGKEAEERLAKCWELVRVITTTIAPERWRSGLGAEAADAPRGRVGAVGTDTAHDGGGVGAIAAATAGNVEVLVVTQNYHVHRQVAELLEQLRKAAEGK